MIQIGLLNKSHTLQNVLKLIRLSEFEGSGHLFKNLGVPTVN